MEIPSGHFFCRKKMGGRTIIEAKIAHLGIFSCEKILEPMGGSSLDLQGRWGDVGVHFANDLTRGSNKLIVVIRCRVLVGEPNIDGSFCALGDQFLNVFVFADHFAMSETPF